MSSRGGREPSFLLEGSTEEATDEGVHAYHTQHGDEGEGKLYDQRDIIDVSGLGKANVVVASTHDGSGTERKKKEGLFSWMVLRGVRGWSS